MSGGAPLTNNTINGNKAEEGGGLYINGGSDPTLTNNIIADNQATKTGSGFFIDRSSPRLLHTTIARNTGGDGRGIYATGTSDRPSTVYLTNTIIVSHTIGVYAGGNVTLDSTAALWGSGAWANGTDWAGPGTIITGTVNVWGDPAFVDPDEQDYHIGPGSAALNQGVDAGVTTDIDRQPRPYLAPDLGADEYWPPGALKHVYLPLNLSNTP
jgi:hypothetical protein